MAGQFSREDYERILADLHERLEQGPIHQPDRFLYESERDYSARAEDAAESFRERQSLLIKAVEQQIDGKPRVRLLKPANRVRRSRYYVV